MPASRPSYDEILECLERHRNSRMTTLKDGACLGEAIKYITNMKAMEAAIKKWENRRVR